MTCTVYNFGKERAARLYREDRQTSRQGSGARVQKRDGVTAPRQIGEIAKGIIERLNKR